MEKISQIKQDGQTQHIDLFNETCALHSGNKFEYLCIDSVQEEPVFKCIYCVSDEDVKQNSLIPLKQIIEAEEKNIFANFPITDRNLTKKIKEIAQKPATSEALKERIDQFFKDLTGNIIAKLESVKTNMVTKAQSISNLSGEIISMYNVMSEKENLKQILLDESKPSSVHKSADVKALCARVLSKDSENQQAIQATIEKVAILERTIDFETPKKIQENVIRQLEKIDIFLIEDIVNFSQVLNETKQLFDPNETIKALMSLVKNKFNDVTEESCLKFEEQLNKMKCELTTLEVPVTGSRYANLEALTENQTNEIANLVESLAKINQKADNQSTDTGDELNELKSDELFELISNQVNFCQTEYLHDLKGIFETLRGVFGLFHTRKLNARTAEQMSFNRLSQAQLKNITILAAKVSELTESHGDQYLLSNQPKQSAQSNSADLILQIKNTKFKNTSVEESFNIRRDFDQLLVNYPIFETLPVLQIERTLPPMQFMRSSLDESPQMGITYNGSEVRLTLGAKQYGQCYSQILDNKRGYSLKLTFNRPFGAAQKNYFRIGLILNSTASTDYVLHKTHEAGFYSYLNYGAFNTIKGDKLTSSDLRNVTSQLEFRWCVAKQQFFYSDPTYANINQVDQIHFSPTEDYSFAVYFFCLEESDWAVTISDFKEIDPAEVEVFN